ncbi:MAG TPA: FAD-binding oxidoreductase, partial [Vulgatibacter sp.]
MAFEKMRAPPLVPVDAPPPPVGALAGQLARIVGEANVSIDPSDRMQSASDMWPKAFLWRRLGLAPAPPDVVVRPGTEQEIADVVRFAAEWGTPVTPHGAGSGVCGGALPVRGGITLRLDRLDRILRIDREALTVDVEAGVLGIHLEEALRRQGLTLGHFPSSIGCSTVGGWLAARSAGQCSSRYGKIEDMVRSMRCVVGTGAAIDLARPASGVDWTELMLGSEGVFGVVTRARLRLWPAPEIVLPRGFRFPSQRAGLAAVEAIFRAGLRPSVVRLYDPLSTEVALGPLAAKEKESAHGERPPGLDDLRPDFRGDTASRQALERLAAVGRRYVRPMPPAWRGLVQAMVPALREDDHEEGLGSAVRETLRDVTGAGRNLALSRPGLINRASSMSRRSLLVLVHEGARGEVEPEAAEVRAICAVHGGKDLGGAPGGRWLRDRYAVSYGLPRIFESHGWVDTFEVAAPWGRVATVYDAVRSAVSPHALVMAHFSHAYPDGCSIYFTFVGDARRPEEGLAVYDAAWSAALDAATAEGATLTHHHGVGLLKEPWLRDELGEAGLELLRRMKREWDPAGILNPGKLGL